MARQPCYDCGSTIKGHHTPLCDLAEPKAKRDLPQVAADSQHWSGQLPMVNPPSVRQAIAACRAAQRNRTLDTTN